MKTAGIVLLIGVVTVLGASTIMSYRASSRSPRADVFGTIQLYGNGTIVVETPTAGLREVLVDPMTVVRDVTPPRVQRELTPPGVPTTLADLRPGRWVALWFRGGVHPVPVAGEIDVWNKAR